METKVKTLLLSFVSLSRMASWTSFICLLWAFRTENETVALSALLIVSRRLPSLLASGIAGYLIERRNVSSHHLLLSSTIATAIAPLSIFLIPRTESQLVNIAFCFVILSIAEGFQKSAFYSFSKLRVPSKEQKSFFGLASFLGIFCTLTSGVLGGYLALHFSVPQILFATVALSFMSALVLLLLRSVKSCSNVPSETINFSSDKPNLEFSRAMKFVPVSALCFSLMSLVVTEFPRLGWENPDQALVWTYGAISVGMLVALLKRKYASSKSLEFSLLAGASFLLFSFASGVAALAILAFASFFYAQVKVYVESSIPSNSKNSDVARRMSYAIIAEELLVCALIMVVGLLLDSWSLRAVSAGTSIVLLMYPFIFSLNTLKNERQLRYEKLQFTHIKKISH